MKFRIKVNPGNNIVMRPFFSLPTAGEFGDTSQQTISNQTGLVSLRLSDFSTADAGKLFTRGDHRPVPVIPAKADTSDRGIQFKN